MSLSTRPLQHSELVERAMRWLAERWSDLLGGGRCDECGQAVANAPTGD